MKRTVLVVLITIFVLGLLGPAAYGLLLVNGAYLQLTKAYVAPDLSSQERLAAVRSAWAHLCRVMPAGPCRDEGRLSDAALVQLLDETYLDQPNPLRVVTDTAQMLTPVDFRLRGISSSNRMQATHDPDVTTLWGNDILEARIFLVSTGDWTVSIEARHDDPPPVILRVDIDDKPISELVFGQGDLSWATLATDPVLIPSGFHWLRIWYVNDYFDRNRNADRNAYIRLVRLIP